MRPTRTCAWCGSQDVRPGKKFCGIQCVGKWQSANRGTAPRKGRTCEWCGQTYDAGNATQHYCSTECMRAARAAERAESVWAWRSLLQWEPCVQCGQSFVANGRGRPRRYCGASCADQAKKARDRARIASLPKRPDAQCVRCGTAIRPPAKRCAECRRVWAKAHKGHRSRARKHGVAYESIVARDIYERDGWRCYLCKRKVRKDWSKPHPRNPTLDCIVAMANGGGFVRANVATCCFECNWKKADRDVGQQLALIG